MHDRLHHLAGEGTLRHQRDEQPAHAAARDGDPGGGKPQHEQRNEQPGGRLVLGGPRDGRVPRAQGERGVEPAVGQQGDGEQADAGRDHPHDRRQPEVLGVADGPRPRPGQAAAGQAQPQAAGEVAQGER